MKDNILYNYAIPLTIPILKRNKMMKYKNSIYYIFFKLNGQPFPYVTTREYDMMLNVFNVVSSIYDKHKPKGSKSFFVLKQILIVLGKPNILIHTTTEDTLRAEGAGVSN